MPNPRVPEFRRPPAERYGQRMGFTFRRSVGLGKGLRLNVSKGGASVSKRIGRLTLNSRGGGSFRILRGLSFRFGRR
jgi:hypothetical protein